MREYIGTHVKPYTVLVTNLYDNPAHLDTLANQASAEAKLW